MSGAVKLRECPFCRSEATAMDFPGTKLKPAVTCGRCGADLTAKTLVEAITLWNTRAPDPEAEALRAEVARLRGLVEDVVAGRAMRHQWWMPEEPDCPPELKTPNGEFHSLRCKVCGKGPSKTRVCLGPPDLSEQDDLDMGLPTPVGAIKFRMEQGGHTQRDLARLIGSRSRASEILSGKRGVSKREAATLCDVWGIPARVFLGPPIPAPSEKEAG